MENFKVQGRIFGLMEKYIKDSFNKDIVMETVYGDQHKNQEYTRNIQGNINLTRKAVKEDMFGKRNVNMKVNLKMIRGK